MEIHTKVTCKNLFYFYYYFFPFSDNWRFNAAHQRSLPLMKSTQNNKHFMKKKRIQMADSFLFQNKCAKFEFAGISLAHVLVWVLFVSAYVLNF